MAFVPCASPLYTSRHGSPARPAEYVGHSGVLIESEWRSSSGELLKGAERERLRWKNVLRFQSVPSILQAVKLGAGVSPDIPMIYALPEIEAGRLVPVMKGWRRPPLECPLVTNPHSGSLARVRTFRAWLLERLRETFSGYEKALEAVLS